MVISPKFKRYDKSELGRIGYGDHSYRQIKKGYVYFLDDGEKTKIGHSSNIPQRMALLCSSQKITPKAIYVSELIPFCDLYEFYLHKLFAEKRLYGEWFDISASEAVKSITPGFVVYSKHSRGVSYRMQESPIGLGTYNKMQASAVGEHLPEIIAAAGMADSISDSDWENIISASRPEMMRFLELIQIMQRVENSIQQATNVFNVDPKEKKVSV